MPEHDDPGLISGPPSGETEPGTAGRRRAMSVVAAIGGVLAIIVVVLALALPRHDDAKPKPIESVTQGGPPASSLEQNSQSQKLGNDGP